MNLEQIIDKLKLGAKYRQNCELGHSDCATLLAHLEQLKNAISGQNNVLTDLKKQVVDAQDQLKKAQTTKKKGKK